MGERKQPVRGRTGRATRQARACRLLLLADTHGVVDARIVRLAGACDLVVHAGDIGSAEVLAQLGGAARVVAVRGNNDVPSKWPAAERARLSRLAAEARLDLPGGSLVVVHGDRVAPAARRHEKLRGLYPDACAVVYGHTHRAVCDRKALPWILNPGAAGRTRTFAGPSCLLLEAGARGWRATLRRFAPAEPPRRYRPRKRARTPAVP